jgi:hypothetical protein
LIKNPHVEIVIISSAEELQTIGLLPTNPIIAKTTTNPIEKGNLDDFMAYLLINIFQEIRLHFITGRVELQET